MSTTVNRLTIGFGTLFPIFQSMKDIFYRLVHHENDGVSLEVRSELSSDNEESVS